MVGYKTHTFKALGSTITVQAEIADGKASKAFKEVEQVFEHINGLASRFKKDSQLTLLNENIGYTIEIHDDLLDLIRDAYHAYKITDGNFDPRIFTTLNNLGYVNTFVDNRWDNVKTLPHVVKEEWKPSLHDNKVNIGIHPLDLGGVGKSFTAVKASHVLDNYTENYFINAGGDIIFSGVASDGSEWTVGVDNPYVKVSTSPLAILALKDESVATSSISKHSWEDASGNKYHHIINPRTGLPVDEGVTAVTVIHEDLITAEIWSKSLFFETEEGINEITNNLQLPVLWFTDDNKMHYNEYMKPYIKWSI